MTHGVHAALLAAGRSSRTGASHKLLATFGGVPLIRRSAEVALASKASGVTVVLGHRAAEMRSVLHGLNVQIAHNERWDEGLSTSLIAGFRAAAPDAAGVLVMLADQPFLEARHLDRLMEAFAPVGPGSIIAATDNGRRFNPIIISSSYRSDIDKLSGDIGARDVVRRHAALIREVEIGRAASLDVDTLEAIREAGGVPETVDLAIRAP